MKNVQTQDSLMIVGNIILTVHIPLLSLKLDKH